MKFIPVLSLLFILAVSPAALAEVKPTIEYEYYDVDAGDESRIADEAFKATPIRQGGTKYLGQANCATGYTYTPDQKDGGRCGVGDYELTLNCTVTLPRFTNLSDEIKPKIEAFMERIKYHEHRHCEIFAEYAGKFKKWIDAGPVSGCNSLNNNIKTAFNQTRNECKAVQDQYDKETLHGRTEGADLEWHLASPEDRLLMAEGATAPAVKVVPEITYEYYDVPVKEGEVGRWQTTSGGIEWSAGFNYQGRRNIDETCRVMRYDMKVGCKLTLPRFTGGGEALKPELEAHVEKLKKVQLERCELVVTEADKLVAEVSGDKTFHCDRMRNNITARHNQMMRDSQEAVKQYDLADENAAVEALAAKVIEPKIEYKYYDVPVTDADQALAEALKKTRIGRNGQPVPGGVQMKMGYSYMPKQLADGSCRVLDYDIDLNCEITLPRFQSDNAEVLKKAEPLSEKLKAIELKRCGIAVDHARRLGEWLVGDQTFQCGPMGNNIRGRFNQMFKECQEDMTNFNRDES